MLNSKIPLSVWVLPSNHNFFPYIDRNTEDWVLLSHNICPGRIPLAQSVLHRLGIWDYPPWRTSGSKQRKFVYYRKQLKLLHSFITGIRWPGYGYNWAKPACYIYKRKREISRLTQRDLQNSFYRIDAHTKSARVHWKRFCILGIQVVRLVCWRILPEKWTWNRLRQP